MNPPSGWGSARAVREWNTFVEENGRKEKYRGGSTREGQTRKPSGAAFLLLRSKEEDRMSTRMKELDRVLGGGIVPGSLVLVGGDPGHRQSPPCFCRCARSCLRTTGRKCYYISGEESLKQIKHAG